MIIFLYNYLFNSYKLLNVLIHILKIQGDYKYTVLDEEHDREELDKHNLIEEDMFDEMVDIDGKVNGKKNCTNYIEDESWEVDSDAYSIRSVSSGDDISDFINDNTTDYETTDGDDSDEEF